MTEVEWFVGIDWGMDAHAVCVVDRTGRVVEEGMVAHTAAGVTALVDTLWTRAAGEARRLAVGIERPRGAVVDQLVERGLAVYAINPKQLDRFRDRFTAAGAKDDRRDARVIADSLRTDPSAFRAVPLDHPLVIQLREVSRADEALHEELSRATNQLRDLVYRMNPALLRVCPAADEVWFWSLLRAAPTPADQRRLTSRRVAWLLREHRIRRLEAATVHQVLQEPAVYTAPGVVEAVSAHIQWLLPRVELLATQRREAGRRLEQLLNALERELPPAGDQREHSDVAIVRSMPGIGTRVAARMLAEAFQPLVNRAYHVVRACSGVAPVTRQSGKRRTTSMRYGCNHRLREAFYHWARTGIQRDPTSRAYYAALRRRGHTHGRALRSVGDRLLRLLIKLLSRGEPFDPAYRHPTVTPAPAGA